ncbi:MAG: response regulator, partial [Rhodospirillales bacterium]|nr:response regulator [Rhodospirillales bacterium]
TEDNLVKEARDAGINDFLAKPISASSLMSRITSVLGAPQSYIQTKDYFGPDRRRVQEAFADPDRRAEQMNLVPSGVGKAENQ